MNTQIGLIYGCPVQGTVMGLAIQCRGWKSVYRSSERYAFIGSSFEKQFGW